MNGEFNFTSNVYVSSGDIEVFLAPIDIVNDLTTVPFSLNSTLFFCLIYSKLNPFSSTYSNALFKLFALNNLSNPIDLIISLKSILDSKSNLGTLKSIK